MVLQVLTFKKLLRAGWNVNSHNVWSVQSKKDRNKIFEHMSEVCQQGGWVEEKKIHIE